MLVVVVIAFVNGRPLEVWEKTDFFDGNECSVLACPEIPLAKPVRHGLKAFFFFFLPNPLWDWGCRPE